MNGRKCNAQYGGIIPIILKSKLPMDKIIASLQLLLDAQVPIETVNDLWRALWMAQAHWLHQPKKTDVFYSAICTKEKHS